MLAWTAHELARRGHRVVALDLDLEAPGLHYKLLDEPEAHQSPGVVDLIDRFLRGRPPPADLGPWLVPVTSPAAKGSIRLLPAGPAPADAYWQRLAGLHRHSLFDGPEPGGPRFFAWLRETIEREAGAEFLLIDARTGVTEMGGAAIALLADAVVALSSTSDESVHGTRAVLRAVASTTRVLERAMPETMVVLARYPFDVPNVDARARADWIREFLCEDAEPLTDTLAVDRVEIVRAESQVSIDERSVFTDQGIQVVRDYQRIARWLLHEPATDDTSTGGARGSSLPELAIGEQRAIAEGYRRKISGGETPPPEAIRSFLHLARLLHDAGRPEEGVDTLAEAVETLRKLAKVDPDRVPELAATLTSYGSMLSELGSFEAAFGASEEAVGHYRALAKARPVAFLPYLAGSLSNLGNRLRQLGRREAALVCIGEAVACHRALGKARPNAHRSGLAMSLNNLGNQLSELGRREAALAASEEADVHYRALVKDSPDVFLPYLAGNLSNLSNRLSELGQREPALAAAEEAVAMRRTLARARPDAFLPDLAKSLNNLSNRLSELGRREMSLAAAEEAVDIYRTFAKARPDAHRSELALSLNNLGVSLSELGRREPALVVAEEAVAMTVSLCEQSPEAFSAQLVPRMRNLASRLEEAGQPAASSAALTAAQALAVRLGLVASGDEIEPTA